MAVKLPEEQPTPGGRYSINDRLLKGVLPVAVEEDAWFYPQPVVIEVVEPVLAVPYLGFEEGYGVPLLDIVVYGKKDGKVVRLKPETIVKAYGDDVSVVELSFYPPQEDVAFIGWVVYDEEDPELNLAAVYAPPGWGDRERRVLRKLAGEKAEQVEEVKSWSRLGVILRRGRYLALPRVPLQSGLFHAVFPLVTRDGRSWRIPEVKMMYPLYDAREEVPASVNIYNVPPGSRTAVVHYFYDERLAGPPREELVVLYPEGMESSLSFLLSSALRSAGWTWKKSHINPREIKLIPWDDTRATLVKLPKEQERG